MLKNELYMLHIEINALCYYGYKVWYVNTYLAGTEGRHSSVKPISSYVG